MKSVLGGKEKLGSQTRLKADTVANNPDTGLELRKTREHWADGMYYTVVMSRTEDE